MPYYYVNQQKQANGDNEVHKDTCSYLPNLLNREFLGFYSNCRDAVAKAKERYPRANGCYHCSFPCHTT
ncbi:hypothetical protein FHG64_06225 [Antarcticibacterium flavum]|uniref:Uncharacterized protein n=1 Tax=Antarcticibacterium flavum TaxID=2058175 RepID=A0A5B7X323_9FLAO|nr:hypothetical protein [Antarcticibacterium sp. W02-3]QCY69033.1 hypothetical protein FHG64_06225 [Antarcticibacterium flavum]